MYELEEVAMLSGIDLGQYADPDSPVLYLPGEEGWIPPERVPAPPEEPPHGGTWTDIQPGTVGPGGWPAAVAVRPGNWKSLDPPRYMTAAGDTWSGLAATYLGAPERWKELWDAQPQQWRWNHSPDVLGVGWLVNMTEEARDSFLAWMAAGQPEGTMPGELPPETVGQRAKRWAPWIIGGGILAAVAYAMS